MSAATTTKYCYWLSSLIGRRMLDILVVLGSNEWNLSPERGLNSTWKEWEDNTEGFFVSYWKSFAKKDSESQMTLLTISTIQCMFPVSSHVRIWCSLLESSQHCLVKELKFDEDFLVHEDNISICKNNNNNNAIDCWKHVLNKFKKATLFLTS